MIKGYTVRFARFGGKMQSSSYILSKAGHINMLYDKAGEKNRTVPRSVAVWGCKGSGNIQVKVQVFMHVKCRMQVNKEQYAGWLSGRRTLARIAKAVRDVYLPLGGDQVLKACSEVWACEDTGEGMKILCNLVNRLQPERSKEEIFKELGGYQEPSPARFFGPSDRVDFNQYLLRFPPKSTGGGELPAASHKNQANVRARQKKAVKGKQKTRSKPRPGPSREMRYREGSITLEKEIPELAEVSCMRDLIKKGDGQILEGSSPAGSLMDRPIGSLSP